MNCFERNIRVLTCILTLSVIMQVSAKAQIHTKKYQVDSTITESSDGSQGHSFRHNSIVVLSNA